MAKPRPKTLNVNPVVGEAFSEWCDLRGIAVGEMATKLLATFMASPDTELILARTSDVVGRWRDAAPGVQIRDGDVLALPVDGTEPADSPAENASRATTSSGKSRRKRKV